MAVTSVVFYCITRRWHTLRREYFILFVLWGNIQCLYCNARHLTLDLVMLSLQSNNQVGTPPPVSVAICKQSAAPCGSCNADPNSFRGPLASHSASTFHRRRSTSLFHTPNGSMHRPWNSLLVSVSVTLNGHKFHEDKIRKTNKTNKQKTNKQTKKQTNKKMIVYSSISESCHYSEISSLFL